VAYSGQCLTSESLGGRSANRGECAQACRMPYGLVRDGQPVDLGDRAYLLSPQDLAGLDVLPELLRVGVASLKIEGRLKSPEYVASITRTYRQALDRLCPPTAAEPASPSAQTGTQAALVPAAEHYELNMAFSRGLYPGWFRGIRNQELAHGRFGTKRGVFLGQVERVAEEAVWLRPLAPLKPGDGVAFDAGKHAQGEEGGRIYQVDTQKDGSARLRFGAGDIDFRRVRVGDRIWKTSDPALERELRATFAGEKIRHTRPVRIEVHGHAGAPLTVLIDDGQGHVATARSAELLAPAEKLPLDEERLRAQLGRLGGTPYHLDGLENHLEGALHLAPGALNHVRREAVAALDALRAAPRRWQLLEKASAELTALAEPLAAEAAATTDSPPQIIPLVRDLVQLGAVLEAGEPFLDLYCEFENPKHYREAVARFRAWQGEVAGRGATALWVAPPRIHKPGEEWILEQVRSCAPDGYLVRNPEHLRAYAGARLRGDFSLNAANPLSAEYLIKHYKLERLTASYDLNLAQLEALLKGAPPAWFDLTLHQHMPMFHMEHCVFCAFLSSGQDYRDCGRPCEKHRVALRDRTGALLPLKADAGCRNTVYNPRAQTGAEFIGRLLGLGARSFRVEFVHEGPEEVRRTLGAYRRLLAGELSGGELWRELKLLNQMGVTRGQLEATPQVLFKKR
jgi:U32 family peptidase